MSTDCKSRDQIGSYKRDIQAIIDDFNKSAQNIFEAEEKVLIPSTSQYVMDRRGIIIHHLRDAQLFSEDFDSHIIHITQFAKKLDKRSCLYEYPFEQEFLDKNSWVEHEGQMIAYNLNL